MGDFKLNTCLHAYKRLYKLSIVKTLKVIHILCLVLSLYLISSIELIASTILDKSNPRENSLHLIISDQNIRAHFVEFEYSKNRISGFEDKQSPSLEEDGYNISFSNSLNQKLVFDISLDRSICYQEGSHDLALSKEKIENDIIIFQDQVRSLNDFLMIIDIERLNPQLENPINIEYSIKSSRIDYPDVIEDEFKFRVLLIYYTSIIRKFFE